METVFKILVTGIMGAIVFGGYFLFIWPQQWAVARNRRLEEIPDGAPDDRQPVELVPDASGQLSITASDDVRTRQKQHRRNSRDGELDVVIFVGDLVAIRGGDANQLWELVHFWDDGRARLLLTQTGRMNNPHIPHTRDEKVSDLLLVKQVN